MNQTANLFTSPINERIASGNGMRGLPRLSESQAVGNFREIFSEKASTAGPGTNVKYRHVSHKDFRSSQETNMCTSNNDTRRFFAKSKVVTNSIRPNQTINLEADDGKNN